MTSNGAALTDPPGSEDAGAQIQIDSISERIREPEPRLMQILAPETDEPVWIDADGASEFIGGDLAVELDEELGSHLLSQWAIEGIEQRHGQTVARVQRRGSDERVLVSNVLEPVHVGQRVADRELWRRIGLWRDIHVWFEADDSQEPIVVDTWVPILRCHCPPHAKSKGSITLTNRTTSGVKGSMSFMGLTGGTEHVLAFTLTSGLEADDEGCAEIIHPARLTLTLGRTEVTPV